MYKQILDILKNKLIILMIFMYPVLTYVFYFALNDTKEAINMMIPIFITMHIIMAPIICMSSIISEEKEKNTLKVLFFADVKGYEYLLGVGIVLLGVLAISIIPYFFIIKFTTSEIGIFYFFSIIGFISSLLLGAVIGISAKSQMSVGTISSPLSMIIGLLPMVSIFNSNINKFSKVIYSKRIYDVVYNFLLTEDIQLKSDVVVCLLNMTLFVLIFCIVYKRMGVIGRNE